MFAVLRWLTRRRNRAGAVPAIRKRENAERTAACDALRAALRALGAEAPRAQGARTPGRKPGRRGQRRCAGGLSREAVRQQRLRRTARVEGLAVAQEEAGCVSRRRTRDGALVPLMRGDERRPPGGSRRSGGAGGLVVPGAKRRRRA